MRSVGKLASVTIKLRVHNSNSALVIYQLQAESVQCRKTGAKPLSVAHLIIIEDIMVFSFGVLNLDRAKGCLNQGHAVAS